MKKIFYLLALGSLALSACQKNEDLHPVVPVSPGQIFSYTLASADYSLLPSNIYASTSLNFLSNADANNYVPTILSSKFANYPDGSKATVTYNMATPPPTLKLADSVYNTAVIAGQPTGLIYTLVNPTDYNLTSKYADFSVAQLLAWLPLKYTAPVANQLEVLTWIFYPTVAVTAPQIYPGLSLTTTVVGTTTTTMATGSFLYFNGAWTQVYQLTPAQYAAVGAGQYNQFQTSNSANIVSYINGILKADPSVAATATLGSIQYVSFNFYNNSSSPSVTSQRVIPMVFDGTNWGRSTLISTASETFTKTNGVWVGAPTIPSITVTIAVKDPVADPIIEKAGFGTAAQITNLTSYGDFESSWATSDLDGAFIAVLKAEVATPQTGYNYNVVYPAYINSADVNTTFVFQWNGTAWVPQQ